MQQNALHTPRSKVSGPTSLASSLVTSGASQINTIISAASSASQNVHGLISTAADMASKELIEHLPTSLIVGTQYICLELRNLAHFATILPTSIGQGFRFEIETYRRLSIIRMCLMILACLMVLVYISLLPIRDSRPNAKLLLSTALLFGLSSVIVDILLPE